MDNDELIMGARAPPKKLENEMFLLNSFKNKIFVL